MWSDPASFSDSHRQRLEKWSGKFKRLFVPTPHDKTLQNQLANVAVYPFCDAEDSWVFSRNISPLYPRSYVSMTAYKALAIALFLGYEKVYICGFDNTYIRNFHVDEANRVYRLDEHFDSVAYPNGKRRDYWPANTFGAGAVAELLVQYARLFKDLHRFPADRVINLDANSLVDAFAKSHDLDVYDPAVSR